MAGPLLFIGSRDSKSFRGSKGWMPEPLEPLKLLEPLKP